MRVEYSSNNSGGGWWLKDEDWLALEKAGRIVQWCKDDKDHICVRPDGRFLGALATEATKPNCSSLREAVEEWEKITGACATDAGCPCCGQPHRFGLYDDTGKCVESGPETEYTAHF